MPLAQRSERGLNDVLGGRYNPKMILWPFDPCRVARDLLGE